MKPRLILIGGGGHCAACIDVIELAHEYEIAGIIDKDASNKISGYPLLGNDEALAGLRSEIECALITIGQIRSPEIRNRLFQKAKSLGFVMPSIVSPRAYVSGNAVVGEGTIVMHDALINARANVGSNCIINSKALVEHDAIIEDNCHIATGAIVNGGALVRRGTFIGSNAVTKEGVKTKENDFISAGALFKGHANE